MSEYPELYILWCKDCGKVPKIKIIFPEGTGNDVKINYTCQCENNKEISIKDFINLFRHEIIFEGKYCELCYRDYMKESEKNKELEKYKIRDKKGFTCPFCYNYYCEDDKIYHFIQSKHKDNFLCTQAIKEKEKEEEEEKKEEEKKEEEKKEEEKKEEEKKEEEKKEEENISELESEVEKLEKEFEENKENENVKNRLGELYDKLVTYYQKNDPSKVTELLMKQSAFE